MQQTKRAHKDFIQICDYCEQLQCRHKLFSNYFGDDPPNCQKHCDVCKDLEKAKKALDVFNQLSMNIYTGTVMSNGDTSDLYEGKFDLHKQKQ